jgi:putative aldouronate transport system substrate-binding protein
MNIHFDVTMLEEKSRAERLNLMFASNDLPDIFFANVGISTVSIYNYGSKEKQLIPLNDLIGKYAPVLKGKLEEYPEIRAQSTCSDGNIYSLPSMEFSESEQYATKRPWINKLWLDKLSLKMPETLDDLYVVLKAFKEKDPNGNGRNDEIPLGGGASSLDPSAIISSALGYTNPGIEPSVLSNGEADMFVGSVAHGEYLIFMNKLFNEGLLDNDYYTATTAQVRAKGAALRVGCFIDSAPHTMTTTNWKDYVSLKPLTNKADNKKIWPDINTFYVSKYAISSVCKNPEAAMRFADYFYTDEGGLYSAYGPEKGSPDTLGLIPGWTWDPEKGIVFDFNGTPYTQTIDYIYGIIAPKALMQLGQSDPSRLVAEKYPKPPEDTTTAAWWWRNSFDETVRPYLIRNFPTVYFDNETNDRVLELTSIIRDYRTMMDAKFITGVEPISGIEGYLNKLKELGADELRKIYLNAYSIYKNL